ncbi:MFS transporter [Pseudovibrio ascidiaceicola]|uniref:MFS transporter n=1 Tax=Pseudovibrio ascidiaceicola TaxID=285279 RepID=UPI001AD8EE37|nr:MFS transporter [Pseudovibrio ascidiaceicola]
MMFAKFSRRYLLTLSVGMALAALLSVVVTLAEVNSGLNPFLLAKARSVTKSVKQNLEYASQIGIPFSEIRGVSKYLIDLTTEHKEISSISIIGAEGYSTQLGESEASHQELNNSDNKFILLAQQTLSSLSKFGSLIFGSDDRQLMVSTNVVISGAVVAQVQTILDVNYVNSQLTSIFLDTFVLLLAACLIAIEVVIVCINTTITEPFRLVEAAVLKCARGHFGVYRGADRKDWAGRFIRAMNQQNDKIRETLEQLSRAKHIAQDETRAFAKKYKLYHDETGNKASVTDARIPLFVFCFADELQKSFLPFFSLEYYSENDWLEQDIMMGLPISAFMLVVAITSPFSGQLIERFSNKTLYLAGLVPAIGGYILCILAQSATDIVIARSITAIGYGIITISCQSYIAAVAAEGSQAKAMATYVGVTMTATMCGTAIGAILADWIGYKPVFAIAISLMVLAGILGWQMLQNDLPSLKTKTSSSAPKASKSLVTLLGNVQFVAILMLCAIPTKIILTGFLYFFVPIYLASLDASQSEIGRVMMVYSLIIIPISPLASRLSDQLGKNLSVITYATIASGVVLLALYQNTDVVAVLIVVALVGVAHAFIKAPIMVAVMEAVEKDQHISKTGALSFLRMFERVGSAAGPLIVAAMLVRQDYTTVAALLGAAIISSGVIMLLVSRSSKREAQVHA